MTKPSWADKISIPEPKTRKRKIRPVDYEPASSEDTIHAVRMTRNTNPDAKDQISDVGKSYDECVTSAKLYCETSRYRLIEIITMRIMKVERIKGTKADKLADEDLAKNKDKFSWPGDRS